jgi:hypothetical protein
VCLLRGKNRVFKYTLFTLIFTYTLLLPEGQRDEAWKPPKKRSCFGNREVLDRDVLSLIFKGLTGMLLNYYRHRLTVLFETNRTSYSYQERIYSFIALKIDCVPLQRFKTNDFAFLWNLYLICCVCACALQSDLGAGSSLRFTTWKKSHVSFLLIKYYYLILHFCGFFVMCLSWLVEMSIDNYSQWNPSSVQ